MTTIKVRRAGREMEISISGHSGYAPSGQDIVCAGISTLGQTAAMMFAEMESAGELEIFTSEKSAGKLLLAIKAYKHTKAKAAGIYNFFCTGARLIAGSYPANVTVDDLSSEAGRKTKINSL